MRLLLAVLLAVAACHGSKGDRGVPEARQPSASGFDWAHPEAALALGADDAAARLGSFDQESRVSWTVGRGPGTRTVTATERHRVRQLAGGDFEASSDVDTGGGPGTETGRDVVFVRGVTFARSRHLPFRERPEDRGHEARRARDESFRLAADVAALCGPALAFRPAGDASVLGRPAKRFVLSLSPGAAAQPPAPPTGRSGDADTKARLEFLEGRTPLSADGEVALDAATGAPLWVRLRATFGAAADGALRADVDLDARVVALGGAVPAVSRPAAARPDERKPNGPARALEAAGLRERGKPAPGEPPAEEGAEEPAE